MPSAKSSVSEPDKSNVNPVNALPSTPGKAPAPSNRTIWLAPVPTSAVVISSLSSRSKLAAPFTSTTAAAISVAVSPPTSSTVNPVLKSPLTSPAAGLVVKAKSSVESRSNDTAPLTVATAAAISVAVSPPTSLTVSPAPKFPLTSPAATLVDKAKSSVKSVSSATAPLTAKTAVAISAAVSPPT